MFSRFTDRARKAMNLAQVEAKKNNCQFVHDDHILLGLILEGGGMGVKILQSLSPNLLQSLSLNLDRKIRLAVEQQLVGRTAAYDSSSRLPLSAASNLVVAEANGVGKDYVGTEHLLYGLAMAPGTPSFRILHSFGVTADRVKQAIDGFLKMNEAPPVEEKVEVGQPDVDKLRDAVNTAIDRRKSGTSRIAAFMAYYGNYQAAVEQVLARELPIISKESIQRTAAAVVKLFARTDSAVVTPDNSGAMSKAAYDLAFNPNLGEPHSPRKSDYDLMMDKMTAAQGLARETDEPIVVARQPDPHMPDELKLSPENNSVWLDEDWHEPAMTDDLELCREIIATLRHDHPTNPKKIAVWESRLEVLTKLGSAPPADIGELIKNGWSDAAPMISVAPLSPNDAAKTGMVSIGGYEFESTEYDSEGVLVVPSNENPPEVCASCETRTGLACHHCKDIVPVCADCKCPKCGK